VAHQAGHTSQGGKVTKDSGDSDGSSADNDSDSADNGDNGSDDPHHGDPPRKPSACKSDGSPKRADQRDCGGESAGPKKDKPGKNGAKEGNDDPCANGGKGWFNRASCALRGPREGG
jgi:hypothetical protein